MESAFIGVFILELGEHSTIIRKLVVELNSLVFKMMFIFSKLLPALVFLTIFQELMTTDVSSFEPVASSVSVDATIRNYTQLSTFSVISHIDSRIRYSLNPGRQNSRRPFVRSSITPCWSKRFLYLETWPLFFFRRKAISAWSVGPSS